MLRFFSNPVAGLTVAVVALALLALIPHVERLLDNHEWHFRGPEIEIKRNKF